MKKMVAKNRILYVLTKPRKGEFNTPSFLIPNLELIAPSSLFSSFQSSIQKPSMTPYLCGCICRLHFQDPLNPSPLQLFNPISHYRSSQICTQLENTEPLYPECHGSYNFFLNPIYYFYRFKRGIYRNNLGRGRQCPKISTTVQTTNSLTLSPLSLPMHPPMTPSSPLCILSPLFLSHCLFCTVTRNSSNYRFI